MKLYHGTSKENAKSILVLGFDKLCWFTTNRIRASYFGFMKSPKSNMCLSIDIHHNTINSRYHYRVIYDDEEKHYSSKDWLLDTTLKNNLDKRFIPSVENVSVSQIKIAKSEWKKTMRNTLHSKRSGDKN